MLLFRSCSERNDFGMKFGEKRLRNEVVRPQLWHREMEVDVAVWCYPAFAVRLDWTVETVVSFLPRERTSFGSVCENESGWLSVYGGMGPHLDLCSCLSCRFCPEREPPPGSVCEGEIWLGWRSVHEGMGRLDLYQCIVEMYSSIAEESSERHRTRTTLRNKIPVRHKSTFV